MLGKRNSQSQAQVVDREDLVDLSRAMYSPSLSSTSMDEETRTFYVTMDKVTFKKPLEIITAVLDANGYALNLENILACFDEFTVAARVQLTSRKSGDGTPLAKDFMPCIQFQLPDKEKVGPVLQRFYSEIENYEDQLAQLAQKSVTRIKQNPKKDLSENSKDLERLKDDNSKLKAQVEELSARLAEAAKFQANANKALASQNIMPPNLRLATVREINWEERTVLVKVARTAYLVPMCLLFTLPKPGDSCLLHLEDGKLLGAFCLGRESTRWRLEEAHVLAIENSSCKLRDARRKIHTIPAKNEEEKRLFQGFRRHEKLVVYIFGEHIVRIEKLADIGHRQHLHRVQEAIACHQLQEQVAEEARQEILQEDN